MPTACRRAAARLAQAAPPEPARPGGRGRRVGPPPELRRDRPLASRARAAARTWPSTSTSRCATATRCCSPPATRPLPRARRSTTPELAPVRDALQQILAGHEPVPGGIVDRRWNLVAANRAAGAAHGRRRPGAARAAGQRRCGSSLHPDGLAPRIANLGGVERPPARRACSARSASPATPTCGAAARGSRLPGVRAEPTGHAPDAPRCCSCRSAAHRRRRPPLLQHRRDVRHRRRHHRGGAGDRVVLPRRRARPPTAVRRHARRAAQPNTAAKPSR